MSNNTLARVTFNEKFGLLSLWASIQNIKFICTSYSRTAAEQHQLYLDDKSECDGYNKISYHQLDRARDIAIVDDSGVIVNDYGDHPDYARLGEIWESLGGRWGGNFITFRDVFHYEL